MSRIPSSLNNVDTAVNRNIDKSNFDNIKLVAQNIDDVITVSNDLELANNSKLKIVSDNITDISFVANNINAVEAIGINIDNLNEIVPVLPEITDVANIKDSVVNVSDYTTSIDNVSNNINSINNVNLVTNAIDTLSEYTDEIVIDANNISSIQVVANDLMVAGWSNITDAGLITDNIEVTPQNTSAIITVANNILDVSTNSDNIISINTVANNISSINTIVSNIVDIQNAEENANTATAQAGIAAQQAVLSSNHATQSGLSADASSNSATLSYKWANELEDTPVTGVVGIDDEYSAYHWAKKAEAIVGGNITLDSLYDVDTTGITTGYIIRYDETTGWKAYDFNQNPKIGFNLTGSSINTGELAWNPNEGTLDIGLNNGSILQVGQENIRLVRNDTGSIITNGTVCMFDGTIGNSGRIKVKPFTGIKGTESYLYGIATQDITAGSDGYVAIDGKVRNINTTGSIVGETWKDGDVLWIKPNGNGRLTNIEPSINEIKIVVACVIKSHTSGTLEVRLLPIDRNFSYSQAYSDTRYVPLNNDFNLDLGEL